VNYQSEIERKIQLEDVRSGILTVVKRKNLLTLIKGVRRWPLFLSAVQTILKLIATGQTPAVLPTLNWEWYEREDTVGQVRRRIIEHCRPPLSRAKVATASLK
jgi:hypothetical protein